MCCSSLPKTALPLPIFSIFKLAGFLKTISPNRRSLFWWGEIILWNLSWMCLWISFTNKYFLVPALSFRLKCFCPLRVFTALHSSLSLQFFRLCKPGLPNSSGKTSSPFSQSRCPVPQLLHFESTPLDRRSPDREIWPSTAASLFFCFK